MGLTVSSLVCRLLDLRLVLGSDRVVGSELVLSLLCLVKAETPPSFRAATDGWVITTPPISLSPDEDKFLFTSFLFLFTLFSRLSGVEGFECELLCVLSASLRLRGGTVARGGLEDRGEELFILVTPGNRRKNLFCIFEITCYCYISLGSCYWFVLNLANTGDKIIKISFHLKSRISQFLCISLEHQEIHGIDRNKENRKNCLLWYLLDWQEI